ncbi:tyramine receptor tyra-2-like [Dreissena polymorpha]|uniref:G-protein coupled receptors family 1 profile domain-containing protein n=1 Tax=Dreissena polymorpha TaxID=45954 RepID=A0A9D4LKQ1_DREPO|nr:tyramine receptor tyra-2-like [Dreissena polymorpha]KAH3860525.1 hypothetical protein DPMN_023426 [Dreissena polymorpha]
MDFNSREYILRKDAGDHEWTAAKSFLVPFMGLMNVIMFFGNLLSIATIMSTPKLRQQTSYWFVMNLAVIDLLISVTVVPLNTIWEYHGTWPFSQITCEFFTFADIAFSTISAYSIMLVSIDKYIYITYSIHYFEKMTRRLAVILICAVWICVFIFAIISLVTEVGTDDNFKDHFLYINNTINTCLFVMTDAYVIPSAIISFFIPFVVLCFTSSKIICIASRHIKKITHLPHTFTYTSDTDSDSIHSRSKNHKIEKPCPPAKSPLAAEENTELSNCTTDGCYTSELKCDPQSTNYNEHDKETSFNGPQNNNKSFEQLKCEKCESSEKDHKNGIVIMDVIYENILKEKETPNKTECVITRKPRAYSFPRATSLKLKSNKGNNMPVKRTQSLKVNQTRLDTLRLDHMNRKNSIKSVSNGKKKKRLQYCKLFGTITIVIFCFIIMFAPYNVAIVVDVWCHCIEPWVYEDILAVLYYMHSLVNPFIYMATDRKFKTALRQLWQRICRVTLCLFRHKL